MCTFEEYKLKPETGCCKKFDPAVYDEKTHIFKDKLFLKTKVRCLFYFPLNYEAAVKKAMAKIKDSRAAQPECLKLCDKKFWKSDLYISIKKEIPGTIMYHMNGTFLSKVFEGAYGKTGDWITEMHGYARTEGKEIKKIYIYHPCCPKCIKKYDKNYLVLFAEV